MTQLFKHRSSHPKQKVTYIAVAGNIGCGKSTFVDFLYRNYGLEPFFEPNAKNPYLVDFYGDMKRWGFHSQLYFLTHKFRIHQQLELQRAKGTVVQDRTIYEDAEIFAAHLHKSRKISKRDWQIYSDLYQSLVAVLQPPDLMIYLRANVRTIRKRIKLRGRKEEQAIPTRYLSSLNKLYEEWFSDYNRSPSIVLETDNMDYLTDLEHLIELKGAIESYV